jgi:hypothetical protein
MGKMKVTLLVLVTLALPAYAGSIQIPCPNGVAPASADTTIHAGFALDELVSLLCQKLIPTDSKGDAIHTGTPTAEILKAAATETETTTTATVTTETSDK